MTSCCGPQQRSDRSASPREECAEPAPPLRLAARASALRLVLSSGSERAAPLCSRVIAADLPGFGDSDKPIGASYDARFFAGAAIDLLNALALDRVHPDRQQP